MKKINIAIYDRQMLLAELLRILIKDKKDYTIIDAVDNADNVYDILENKRIDILFFIVSMFKQSCIDMIEDIDKKYPDVSVIVICGDSSSNFIKKCLNANASGFISNFANGTEIADSIKAISLGTTYICEKTLNKLVSEDSNNNGQNGNVIDGFTKRESEILNLISLGFSNKDIADKLFISVRTVETHRRNILRKNNEKNFYTLLKTVRISDYMTLQEQAQ